MRRLISAALLLLVCSLGALAQAQTTNPTDNSAVPTVNNADQNSISQMLIQREKESWAARRSQDASYFQQQTRDDARAHMENGTVEDKNDFLSRTKNDPLDSYDLRDFNVSFPTADTAIVTYTAHYTGRYSGGGKFDQTRRVTDHWQRTPDGDWTSTRVDFSQ